MNKNILVDEILVEASYVLHQYVGTSTNADQGVNTLFKTAKTNKSYLSLARPSI